MKVISAYRADVCVIYLSFFTEGEQLPLLIAEDFEIWLYVPRSLDFQNIGKVLKSFNLNRNKNDFWRWFQTKRQKVTYSVMKLNFYLTLFHVGAFNFRFHAGIRSKPPSIAF